MSTEPMTTEQPTPYVVWLLRDGQITEHVEGSPEFKHLFADAYDGPLND